MNLAFYVRRALCGAPFARSHEPRGSGLFNWAVALWPAKGKPQRLKCGKPPKEASVPLKYSKRGVKMPFYWIIFHSVVVFLRFVVVFYHNGEQIEQNELLIK
jgi:hypothetical protein